MGVAESVALAVGGDRDAFAALYDEFAPGVNDFLRRMLGDPHDAADALQDTFIAAGARLHQLRDPAKFRPWLYAIARRQAYSATSSRARRRSRDAELPEDELVIAAPEVDPTDAVAGEELGRLIADAAEGLDERDRAVLHLHFRQGLSGDELALALGVERGNAHVLVHRVRERLQTSLGALLVARHGRSACPQLDALLGGWDGTLTTVVRKRVNRHAEACATCGETRSRSMRPAALLGALPLAPLPASAREAVLGRVELCSYTGEPWPGGDGFPPGDDRPVDDGTRGRARRVLVAAVVALVVFLLAGSVVLADADRVDRGVPAPTSSTASTASTAPTGPAATAGDGSSSSVTTVPGPATTAGPGTPTSRRPTTPTTRRPTVPTRPTAPTTSPPTTEPPTTAPPATEPPTTAPPATTSTTRRPPTTRPTSTSTSTTLRAPNPPAG